MAGSETEVYIDLTGIGPDLVAEKGSRASIEFAAALREKIIRNLEAFTEPHLVVEVHQIASASASSKSGGAAVVLGGILISILASGGYSITPEKATHLVQGIWNSMRQLLPKKTHVKVTSGKVTIDIDANSQEAARVLLQAGAEVLNNLRRESSKSSKKPTRALTLSPRKR